jgi:hypothetical protein
MFIVGQCSKCKNYGLIDIGKHSKEEVDNFLKKAEFGECSFGGWHVELGKMDEYINLDWDEVYVNKEEAQKVVDIKNKRGEN